MQRNVWRAGLLAIVILLIGALPAMAQTSEDGRVFGDEGQVLVGIQQDVSLPVGEKADALVVIDGTATIEGDVNGLVMIGSDVVVQGPGAVVDGFLAIGGTLTIGDGATVNEGAYANTVVTHSPGAIVAEGDLHNIQDELAGALGFIVAGLLVVIFFVWIGFAIATLFSSLLVVAFGTSQLRRAAFNIGNDVLKTLVAGFLALVVPLIVIALLAITIVGIPLAIGLTIMYGLVAFLGYLVVGLWIGERVLRRSRTAARPYGAAFLGVLILMLLSWIPFVSTLAIWFGTGAVTLAGWRVLRGRGLPPPPPPGYGFSYGQPLQVPPPPYAPPPYAPPPAQYPPQYPPYQGGPPTNWQ